MDGGELGVARKRGDLVIVHLFENRHDKLIRNKTKWTARTRQVLLKIV